MSESGARVCLTVLLHTHTFRLTPGCCAVVSLIGIALFQMEFAQVQQIKLSPVLFLKFDAHAMARGHMIIICLPPVKSEPNFSQIVKICGRRSKCPRQIPKTDLRSGYHVGTVILEHFGPC